GVQTCALPIFAGDIWHQFDQFTLDNEQSKVERCRQHLIPQRLAYGCLFALHGNFRLLKQICQLANRKELSYLFHIFEGAVNCILLARDIEDGHCVATRYRSFKYYCSFLWLVLTNSSTRRRLSLLSTDFLMTLLTAVSARFTTRSEEHTSELQSP